MFIFVILYQSNINPIIMWRFLKNVFSSAIGFFLALFLFFIFLSAVAGAFLKSATEKTATELEPNTVLKIHLDKKIKEHINYKKKPIDELLDLDFSMGLHQITTAIKNATTDPNITGVSIEVNDILATYTQVKTIRDALEKFKKGYNTL